MRWSKKFVGVVGHGRGPAGWGREAVEILAVWMWLSFMGSKNFWNPRGHGCDLGRACGRGRGHVRGGVGVGVWAWACGRGRGHVRGGVGVWVCVGYG